MFLQLFFTTLHLLKSKLSTTLMHSVLDDYVLVLNHRLYLLVVFLHMSIFGLQFSSTQLQLDLTARLFLLQSVGGAVQLRYAFLKCV